MPRPALPTSARAHLVSATENFLLRQAEGLPANAKASMHRSEKKNRQRVAIRRPTVSTDAATYVIERMHVLSFLSLCKRARWRVALRRQEEGAAGREDRPRSSNHTNSQSYLIRKQWTQGSNRRVSPISAKRRSMNEK